MNNTVRFALSLGLILGLSIALHAQSVTPVAGHALSQHELKREIITAHTSEQYNALALYFRQREQLFREKAGGEKADWESRKQVTVSLGVKYPTPTDSARNLYKYDTYEADQMARRAAEYESRAARLQSATK